MAEHLFTQFDRNITIQWLIPQRIILIQARGSITSQQREWAHAEIIAMIHSCSTPSIHLVSHTSQVTHMDWSVFSRPSGLVTHPRRGWWINIGDVPTIPVIWLSRLMARLIRRRYIYRSTLQEALEALQKLDPNLPDLSLLMQNGLQEVPS